MTGWATPWPRSTRRLVGHRPEAARMRFLLGLWLTQAITAVLVVLALRHGGDLVGMVPYAVAGAGVGARVAYGFALLAERERRIAEHDLERKHAKDRQDIRLAAERLRSRTAERLSAAEVRIRDARTGRLKAGAIAGGAAGIGVTLLLTQFIALGMAMVAFGIGAAGGYGLRGWQVRRNLPSAPAPSPVQEDKPAGRLSAVRGLITQRKTGSPPRRRIL